MPPVGSLVGIEFLHYNALRNYPLDDEATRYDTSGTVQVPNDLIVDLTFPIAEPATYDPAMFHLSEIAVFGDWVIISLGYDGEDIAHVSVSNADHIENKTYFLQGKGDFDDSIGKISIGKLDTVIQLGGKFRFDVTGGRILPTRIQPDVRGVKSITTVNANSVGTPLDGDVHLVAGNNIRLTPVQVDIDGNVVSGGTSYNGIRVDAISGENLTEECECENERQLAPPIRRINGQTANSAGDFLITGNACLTITSGTNGLFISDVCAEPCCGSDELKRISDDQDNLWVDVRTMDQVLQKIEFGLLQMRSLEEAIKATGFLGDI